jgi:hypothetical protein
VSNESTWGLRTLGTGTTASTPHRNQGAEVTTKARGTSVLRASETTAEAISMLRAGGRI